MYPRCWLILIIVLAASSARAQDTDLSLLSSDSLSSADSLSIFALVDSLIELQEAQGSQLAVRLSYNSNVLSAGRTLGIANFGLAPSLSYFHKSGLYADVSAYWSKDFDPSYYLTIASVGYMKDFSKHVSVMAALDKYFYNLGEEAYIPFRQTVSITPVFDFKPVTFSVNYSFYFGDEYAHRLMPGISVTTGKHKLWKIDRVSLSPAFYALWGNSFYTTIEDIPPSTFRERRQNILNYGTPWRTVTTNHEVYGFMNYAVSIPLFISYKNWSFNISYIYNIPKTLPGEPDTLEKSSYVTGGILYLIDLSSIK